MLGPVARSRASLAAAVLLTAAAGGAVLAAESSPVAGAAVHSVPLLPVYGPSVPTAPADPLTVRPLLTPGALLAPARVPQLPPVSVVAPPPAAPLESAPPQDVVGPGSPAEQVRQVQRLLNAAGAALVVDGAWGPATERAVRRAQSRSGLPVDGRVGRATWTAVQTAARDAG